MQQVNGKWWANTQARCTGTHFHFRSKFVAEIWLLACRSGLLRWSRDVRKVRELSFVLDTNFSEIPAEFMRVCCARAQILRQLYFRKLIELHLNIEM